MLVIGRNLDDFKQYLEYAKGNVSSFDYSFNIDEGSQKISVSVDCKIEHYDWEPSTPGVNGSVIYDYHREVTLDYNNFVASSKKIIEEYTVDTFVNETYLENNDMTIYTDSKYTAGATPETDGGEIPGFELISLLGIATVAVLSVIYITKRKKDLK